MRVIPDRALAAVTIDTEAEGEPYEAKLGVAEVLRNRMRTKYFSNGTLADTVLRRWQFSAWTHSSDADLHNLMRALVIDDKMPAVADCLRAWDAAEAGSNTVSGARLFYAMTQSTMAQPPSWATTDKFVCQFGKVRFYHA